MLLQNFGLIGFTLILVVASREPNNTDSQSDNEVAALEFPQQNFTSKIPIRILDATNTVPKRYKPKLQDNKETKAPLEFPSFLPTSEKDNMERIKTIFYDVSTESSGNKKTKIMLMTQTNGIYVSPLSEANDLLKVPEKHTSVYNESETVPPFRNSESPINNEVESIENGSNTEDNRVNHKILSSYKTTTLVQGQIAAILAGVFVVGSIVAYIGLLSWRRYLENRYGSRQMLVDEDFYDPADMRNFSI